MLFSNSAKEVFVEVNYSEVNYKYCKRCQTKVSLNATKCLVCNGREFVTQDEVDQVAEALLSYAASQLNTRHTNPLERFLKWLGLIS